MGIIIPILQLRNSSEWDPLAEVHSASSSDKEFPCCIPDEQEIDLEL